MTEEVFHNHICQYLKTHFGYRVLSATDMADKEYYFVESHVTEFIQQTQNDTWEELETNYFGSDTGRQIIKAIKEEIALKPLWRIIRDGIELKGKRIYFLRHAQEATTVQSNKQLTRQTLSPTKRNFTLQMIPPKRLTWFCI